jgi:hypothetical protein
LYIAPQPAQLDGWHIAAGQGYASDGERTHTRQLAGIFVRCREHDIALTELDVSRTLLTYREANAYLTGILTSDVRYPEKVQTMREAIARIKSDPNRAATRT